MKPPSAHRRLPLPYAAVATADTVLAGLARGRASRLRWLTKPALMPALAWWVRSRQAGADRVLVRRTLTGLGLSACGDIALLRDDDSGFLGGVGAFLGAHAAYLAGFCHRAGAHTTAGATWRLAPVAAVWAGALLVFAARAGPLRAPVVLYGTTLAAMQASALLLDHDVPAAARRRIAAGAACFVLSDALLATGRFVLAPRRAGPVEAAVMATYTTGQWLIADGVVRTPGRRSDARPLSRRRCRC